MTKFYQILFISLLLAVPNVLGQSYFMSSKNLALGGGGVTYIEDYRSLFINPANLSLSSVNKNWAIGGLINLNVQTGGPLLNLSAWNKYFTKGDTYNLEQLKNDVLPDYFDGGSNRNLAVRLDYLPLGISYRRSNFSMGLAMRTRALANIETNKGMAMLAIGGVNEELFAEPEPINLNIQSVGFSEISIGYSQKVLDMSDDYTQRYLFAGIAPKVITGIVIGDISLKSKLEVKSGEYIKHDVEYTILASGGLYDGLNNYIDDRNSMPDSTIFSDLLAGDYTKDAADGIIGTTGMGFGLDLGVTYIINPIYQDFLMRISASVTDIGSIPINNKIGTFKSKGTFLFEGVDYDTKRIDEEFDGEFEKYFNFVIRDSLGALSYGNIEKTGTKSVIIQLPTSLNLGTSIQFKKTMYSLDITKGLNNVGLNSRSLIFALGAEWRPLNSFPLRTGVRTGGKTPTTLSFGTGLEFNSFEFSFAAMGSTGNGGIYFGIALGGLVVRF